MAEWVSIGPENASASMLASGDVFVASRNGCQSYRSQKYSGRSPSIPFSADSAAGAVAVLRPSGERSSSVALRSCRGDVRFTELDRRMPSIPRVDPPTGLQQVAPPHTKWAGACSQPSLPSLLDPYNTYEHTRIPKAVISRIDLRPGIRDCAAYPGAQHNAHDIGWSHDRYLEVRSHSHEHEHK